MKIPGIDLIEKLINEHGSSSILRDRLLLLKDQFEIVAKECSDLHEKFTKSEAEVRELQKKLESYLVPDNFVEYKSALLRKLPEGGYAESVFCPRCKHTMSSSSMGFNYKCKPCDHTAEFAAQQLPIILAEVLRKYGTPAKENP
jgi:hypothetical protein